MSENRSHDSEQPATRPPAPPEGHLRKVRRQADPATRLRPHELRPPRGRQPRASVDTVASESAAQRPSSVPEQLRQAALSRFGVARQARIRVFHDAARQGDLDTIRRMVADGCKVNARDEDGRTALHHAYEALRLDAANLLVTLGADVSVHDSRFVTPHALLTHVRNQHVRLLATRAQQRELVDADLQPFGVNQFDANGDTALHLACYRGHWQAVGRLIEFGADQSAANKRDLTPQEYGEVGAAVADLLTLARLFSPSHARSTGSDWTDPAKARTLYGALCGLDRRLFVIALNIAVHPMEHRREVLQVAIKLGVPESIDTLIRVFTSNPTREIAEDYLNSGSSPLESYAWNWADGRGFPIGYSGIGTTAQWGEW